MEETSQQRAERLAARTTALDAQWQIDQEQMAANKPALLNFREVFNNIVDALSRLFEMVKNGKSYNTAWTDIKRWREGKEAEAARNAEGERPREPAQIADLKHDTAQPALHLAQDGTAQPEHRSETVSREGRETFARVAKADQPTPNEPAPTPDTPQIAGHIEPENALDLPTNKVG